MYDLVIELSVHLFYGDGTGPCSTSSDEHALYSSEMK
jgi:hypothetical protein